MVPVGDGGVAAVLQLVPPIFPVFHAEDFSWGTIPERTRPDALAGHLPSTVL